MSQRESNANYLKIGIEPNIPYWSYVRNWRLLGPFEFGLDGVPSAGQGNREALDDSAWELKCQACLRALARPFIETEDSPDRPAAEKWAPYQVDLIDGLELIDLGYYYNFSRGAVLHPFTTGMNFCLAYGLARIYAPADLKLRLVLNADDLIKLWINGKECYADQELRTLTSDPVLLKDICLFAGWNTLMVKVVNLHGAWHFFVRMEMMDKTPLAVNVAEHQPDEDQSLKVRVEPAKEFLRDAMVQAMFVGDDGLCIPYLARITEGMQFIDPLFTIISRDYGKSWTRGFGGGCVVQLPDGSLYSLAKDIEPGSREGEFLARAFRSHDRWKHVEGPFEVPVYCPQSAVGKDDQGNPCGLGVVQTAPLVMPAASSGGKASRILLPVYGWFKTDTVPDDYGTRYAGGGGCYKYRQYLLESTDNGRSFHFLSTIAYEPVAGGPEGFCEAGMALLRNGDILAAMRNGGLDEPVWLARSKDGGITWSLPQKLLTRGGAYPQLLILQSGVLALSYVRNGTGLLFSMDGLGYEWSHPVLLDHTGGNCQVLAEIQPGQLLQLVTRPFPEKVGLRQRQKNVTGTLCRIIEVERII